MNSSSASTITRIPWQAFVFAAAALPCIGVLCARGFLPSTGPRSAEAASTPVVSTNSGSLQKLIDATLSSQDSAFLDFIASSANKPVERSPIAARTGRTTFTRADDRPVPNNSSTGEPTLRATESSVTSILKASGQTIAMIGGKLRRVGDRLSDGWAVKEIDPDAGSVTLVHMSGQTKQLLLRKK